MWYIYKYSTIKLLIGLLVKAVSFTKLRVNFTMSRVTAGLQKLSPDKHFLKRPGILNYAMNNVSYENMNFLLVQINPLKVLIYFMWSLNFTLTKMSTFTVSCIFVMSWHVDLVCFILVKFIVLFIILKPHVKSLEFCSIISFNSSVKNSSLFYLP